MGRGRERAKEKETERRGEAEKEKEREGREPFWLEPSTLKLYVGQAIPGACRVRGLEGLT